jgi:hypothetical protein
MECGSCRTDCTSSVLRTKTNASTAVENHCRRKTRCRRESRIFSSLQLKILCSFGSNIVYLWYIFFILMLTLLHYFEWGSTVFIYLACFLNSCNIFKERRPSLHSGVCYWERSALLPTCLGETPHRQYSSSFIWSLSFLQIFFIQLSKAKTLNIASLDFQPFYRFSYCVTAQFAQCVASLGITLYCVFCSL